MTCRPFKPNDQKNRRKDMSPAANRKSLMVHRIAHDVDFFKVTSAVFNMQGGGHGLLYYSLELRLDA